MRAMQILISMDMEGCAGVVHVDQTRRAGNDYATARRWMTLEANAAALGAFDAGATRVIVNDSHADMRNLLIDELDPRIEVISGALKPYSMAQGLDAVRPNAVFFVGYHGGAGTAASVLDHTYYGAVVSEVRLHAHGLAADDAGQWLDEAAINGLVAGEFGVPVALVTGDQAVTAHARERFASVVTVEVKRSITRYAAESLHPEESRRRIRAGAREAVGRIASLRPYAVPFPAQLTLSMVNTGFADAACIVPGVRRVDARRVRLTASTPSEALRYVLAVTMIAGTLV